MNDYGMIEVRCKYYNNKYGCDLDDDYNSDNSYFDCDDNNVFLSCEESSLITWTSFIINRRHLIEVK
jgi:hypothetical protein